jgi:hypothetical protein
MKLDIQSLKGTGPKRKKSKKKIQVNQPPKLNPKKLFELENNPVL